MRILVTLVKIILIAFASKGSGTSSPQMPVTVNNGNPTTFYKITMLRSFISRKQDILVFFDA